MHITELHQSNSVLLFSVVENIWALEIWNGDIWFGSLLGSEQQWIEFGGSAIKEEDIPVRTEEHSPPRGINDRL